MSGDFGFGEGALFEEPGEQQVHEIGGEVVDRFVGGQVNAVEVIDAAVASVGGE